jgi:hypothetical protein
MAKSYMSNATACLNKVLDLVVYLYLDPGVTVTWLMRQGLWWFFYFIKGKECEVGSI